MRHIWIIASLTFQEAIRRKIVYASLALGVLFLIIFNVGFHFIRADMVRSSQFGQNGRIIMEQSYNIIFLAAMYSINFLSIATAALITADSLAGEINSGIIQSVVTKPIHRYQVAVGKWLGNALLLATYLLMMIGGAVLSILVQSGYAAPHLLAGVLLLFFNSLLIMTVTLAFSSTLSTLATGGVIFGLFGVAFIGGWVERIGSLLHNSTAVNVGIFTSLILPSEAMWNLASNRMTTNLINLFNASPFSSGSVPSPLMVVYTGLYLVGFLAFAIKKFSARDL
jgi:ABC-type transport system involved in multi-copper enzyme maturation permease subunit